MNRVIISIEVFCSNRNCPNVLYNGVPRFVGEDGGLGGRWQCLKCHKWTTRAPAA